MHIQLSQISKSYSENLPSIQCDNLLIRKGQKIGIAGETGSGKSTLLKIIAGLIKPDSGEALFDGQPIFPKLDRLIPGHPRMAYLSQSFELPKFISVTEYLDRHQYDEDHIKSTAELCKIADLLEKDTRSLSGGERQRTALARILLQAPDVLLLDEPYSNLDPHHKRTMKDVIGDVSDNTSTTIIKVSHDPADLLPWAEEILVLLAGKTIQRGTPQKIYNEPISEYVAGMFGEYSHAHMVLDTTYNESEIVRPEHLKINPKGKRGEVISIRYHGAYDLIHVKIGETVLKVRERVGVYQVGEVVHVSTISAESE